MKIGDIVWYKGKQYYLYSLYKGGLCRIVRLRDGKYTHTKNGEEHLNANIVNLDISKLEEDG
jgi:hypothetical protein